MESTRICLELGWESSPRKNWEAPSALIPLDPDPLVSVLPEVARGLPCAAESGLALPLSGTLQGARLPPGKSPSPPHNPRGPVRPTLPPPCPPPPPRSLRSSHTPGSARPRAFAQAVPAAWTAPCSPCPDVPGLSSNAPSQCFPELGWSSLSHSRLITSLFSFLGSSCSRARLLISPNGMSPPQGQRF